MQPINGELVKAGNPNMKLGGASVNPYGRPRSGTTFKDLIAWQMSQVLEDGRTYKQAIVEKIAQMALKGVPWACDWIGDRLEGKPSISMDVGLKPQPLASLTDEQIVRILAEARQIENAQLTHDQKTDAAGS